MWFDGANGGDGYYGGAREKRRIDNRTYYDWENTWKIVRELQPDACMFSDGGPDVRWVGNESGFAGETCWATRQPRRHRYPAVADGRHAQRAASATGTRLAAGRSRRLDPPRLVLSRQGRREGQVGGAVAEDLLRVGRPRRQPDPQRAARPPRPDPRERRAGRCASGGASSTATFATDLARGAKATASNTRGDDPQFAPANAIDGNRDTYWATDDGVTTPELVLDLGKPATFNVVRVREYLPLGQRVDAFALDAWDGQHGSRSPRPRASATSACCARAAVTTSKVRLRITKAAACPAISESGCF